jgi:CheY-like chemotaxis protein
MNDSQRDLFQSRHAYHFLKKPFDKKEAANIIRSHVIMDREYSILVVDDSGTQRKIARRILEASRFKFDIREAENATDAFHQIVLKAPHIILTDFHMPGVDGIEFAGRIREITNKIKIYMMSTDKALYVERSAAFIGTAGFLQKPFTPDDIDALMHKYTNIPIPSFGKRRSTFSFLKKDEAVPEPFLVPLDEREQEQKQGLATPRLIEAVHPSPIRGPIRKDPPETVLI